MYQNEKLSQKQLDNLQMSRIDLTRTEWWGRFQEDILILHNPKFKGSWEPYKLKEHRDVGFYADKMNMTAKYMTTLVKKASGKSALQWIEDYVILEAKAQLTSTVNTIQQIAFDLNFPSQSLFGRYFKRAVSMSPSDYRATHRVFQ